MGSFESAAQGFVEIRDFQTTGVVAFATGLPFSQLQVGKPSLNGHRVQVKREYLRDARSAIDGLASRL